MPLDEQTGLGNKGAPFQVEWKGIRYKLRFLTDKVKAAVIRDAKQNELHKLRDLKGGLEKEDYQERLNKLVENCQDGSEWEFDSAKVQKFRATDAGQRSIIRAHLGEEGENLSDQDLIELIIDKGEEIFALIEMGSVKVHDMLKAVGYDPEAEERKIKNELGWTDDLPEEKKNELEEKIKEHLKEYARRTVDPKAMARCLRAVGFWE